MKKEVKVSEDYILGEYDPELSILELTEKCEDTFSKRKEYLQKTPGCINSFLTHYKLKIIDDSDPYSDSHSARLIIVYYRMQTDQEVEHDKQIEIKRQEGIEKKKQTLLKIKKEKDRKEKEKLKDPDYAKFKELQKKFVKK